MYIDESAANQGARSKWIQEGSGKWKDYIYVGLGKGDIDPTTGNGVIMYDSVFGRPVIKIHRKTGDIDDTWEFGPIDAKETNIGFRLKGNQ